MTRAADAIRGYYERHPWALDVTLIAIVTAVAAALRLTLLGDIPYGVHPDEAQLGTDAHKIMDGHLIGVYTHAALGQPAGHSYFTLPSIWLLGDTAFALRLPLALVGLAAIPLLYLLVRVAYARVEAFFASALLAVSYWHLLYSRVAHWSISYGTVLLAALLCLMLGMQRRRRAWFVASGLILGLGVYTYNIYPIAVVAFAMFVAILSLVRYRGAEWRWWRGSVLMTSAVALVVALPMIVYVARPSSYYWSHFDNYTEVSVMQTREYRDAGALGKARLVGEQAGTFLRAYAWDGERDEVDASGLRATFDPATLILLALGLAMAVRRRREPMVIAALCCFFIIPLPAVLQQGSITREPLGAAPYAMFFAALPLAAIWRAAIESRDRWRIPAMGAVAGIVAIIAATTVHDYFWTWRRDKLRAVRLSRGDHRGERIHADAAARRLRLLLQRPPPAQAGDAAVPRAGRQRRGPIVGVQQVPRRGNRDLRPLAARRLRAARPLPQPAARTRVRVPGRPSRHRHARRRDGVRGV